ncbi:hypothetical protein QEM02_001649 [Pseudomonas putida]|nr:hypothetical protein [Pseudomonas putida]
MSESTESSFYRVLHRLINIVGLVILVPILSVFTLVGFYIWSVFERSSNSIEASQDLERVLIKLWESLRPIAETVLAAVVPILILVVVIGLVKWMAPEKWFNAEKIVENLPSVIALIVILTVCILALASQSIPSTLNSIGLVVIGYYFGKVKA